MTYFQNLFATEYSGYLTEKASVFKLPGNSGRSNELVSVFAEPTIGHTYDLSGNDADGNSHALLYFCLATAKNSDFKVWNRFSVNISGGVPATTTVDQIIAKLNADGNFSTWFEAARGTFANGKFKLQIRNKPSYNGVLKYFIQNGNAEEVLKFNKMAGVADLPSYFHRHVVWLQLDAAEQIEYKDGVNTLYELDPGSFDVDADVITNAVGRDGKSLGLNPGAVSEDYALLNPGANTYLFKHFTYDGSTRVTEVLEYNAGAKVGSLAKKTLYTYTGVATVPTTVCEIPYTLQSADMITP